VLDRYRLPIIFATRRVHTRPIRPDASSYGSSAQTALKRSRSCRDERPPEHGAFLWTLGGSDPHVHRTDCDGRSADQQSRLRHNVRSRNRRFGNGKGSPGRDGRRHPEQAGYRAQHENRDFRALMSIASCRMAGFSTGPPAALRESARPGCRRRARSREEGGTELTSSPWYGLQSSSNRH
jgi:hypothetical protein